MPLRRAILAALALFLLVVFVSPVLAREMFFRVPSPSDDFDCDDATLFMVERLASVGIPATAILGRLTTTGETYSESDHVWVMASVAGLPIALDWGGIQLGRQHYEGYALRSEQLMRFVAQDRQGQTTIPAASPY